MKKEVSFGKWESPISASLVASQSLSFQDLVVEKQNLYWSEMRPDEKGRFAIVQYINHSAKDILPAPFSARTRVHEYGGSAFTVHNNVVYFVNDADQRIYSLTPGEQPIPLTLPGTRFADLHFTHFGLIAIAESTSNTHQTENFLAMINTTNGDITTLHQGYDFYAQISVSPNSKKIAWITWNHPNMPWDNNELWLADLTASGLENFTRIDESFEEQSFFQPQWEDDKMLAVVSDKSNWWNLYLVDNKQTSPLFEVDSEIGLPLWVFNMSTWGYFNGGIVCIYSDDGINKLWHYKDNVLKHIPLPYSVLSQLRVGDDHTYLQAGNPDKPTEIIAIDKDFKFKTIKKSGTLTFESEFISIPEHITYPTTDNRHAHAYFYPPKNKNHQGPADTLPPLIVKSHGGPTASASTSLNLQIQYWTSRGFAFVDVNYAGSTGYGRAYRKSLEKKWGIYDVDDCVHAAKYLTQNKLVDPDKIAITGGSAGGYTTLAALTFTDFFHVGASLYGVSDLEALANDTHKFEARYLESLIGHYPKEKQIYLDRSPIHHVEKLSNPVIFFQGAEDKVVPPAQAEKMYLALKEKGIKTSYVLYDNEQHGFRDAKNIITTLEEQLKFFSEVLAL